MEQYQDLNGEWHVSEWKDGRYYVTREDSHTYWKDETGMVGHTDCYECNKRTREL